MRDKRKRIAARRKKRLGIKQPVALPEVQIVETELPKTEVKFRAKSSSRKRDKDLTEEKDEKRDERQEEENEEVV